VFRVNPHLRLLLVSFIICISNKRDIAGMGRPDVEPFYLININFNIAVVLVVKKFAAFHGTDGSLPCL
jgi:hypothetical protein